MANKILVTGASGFIGSFVCHQLVNYNIVAAVSPFSKSTRINDLKRKIKIMPVNLSDYEDVRKIIKLVKPDCVIHLATHGVYAYQQNDEERIAVDNYQMTFNLLSLSSKMGVKKFINTGSVFEYGSQKGKVKENDVNLNDILNQYSAIKMATTALTNSYADKLQVITLRPFTTYGPMEDESRFIRATIHRALENNPIEIAKNVVRDFVYVNDVAEAYLKAEKVDYNSGEIINIGSGKKSTLENVSSLIKKISKSESKIVYKEKYTRGKESACWADISKAKKVLKWYPKTSLKDGLKKTIDWVK